MNFGNFDRVSKDPFHNYQRRKRGGEKDNQYEQFDATMLYCPKCGQAMPVRKKLLLILPDGDYYNLVCAKCGTSLGKKLE